MLPHTGQCLSVRAGWGRLRYRARGAWRCRGLLAIYCLYPVHAMGGKIGVPPIFVTNDYYYRRQHSIDVNILHTV